MSVKSKFDSSTESKNLIMIQRIDVCAESIIAKATHTALYKFDAAERAWEKTEVDGAMFIYKRVDHPIYSLIIANRQSPQDLIEPILPNIRLKLDKPYVFFCKSDGSIRGLWFYEESDCERIYKVLSELIEELKQAGMGQPRQQGTAIVTSTSATPKPPSAETGNLLSLLMGGGSAHSGKPSPSASLPSASAMPSMLHKLMMEQMPPTLSTAGAMTADDLERDLLRLAGGGVAGREKILPSASALSLAALSTRSVHGSDTDANELDSMMAAPVGEKEPSPSPSPTPSLDKNQLAAALQHLLRTDDEFVYKIHQAYVDALNRRFNI